jgi:phosphatidylglycerol:prolipoprotein diacylglycerol transferase
MPTGFNLGPITINFYGLLIIVGILFAFFVINKEAKRRGQDINFLVDALPWIFIGGVIGARVWHIFTPPQSMIERGITTRYYLTHMNEAVAIWKGGVGIFGAVIGGILSLGIFAKVKKEPLRQWLDIIAPGLALAQSIGRWGNFVNQEVYGLPSNLPWAITIDPQYRLPGYLEQATYHPLFLYESIWSIINMVFLLWMARRFMEWLRPGSLFLMYLIFYGAGRVGLEFLRLDVSAFRGININQTFSGVIALGAAFLLFYYQRNNPSSR